MRAPLCTASAARSRGWYRRLGQVALALVFCLWAGSVVGAMVWQERYAATPGAPAVAPMRWPGGPELPLHKGQFNLLIFLHPRCPCSRSTVSELARITARVGDRLCTRVLVLQYASDDTAHAPSPLYQQAAAIPGVSTQLDRDGTLARRFAAACSGQTFLYDGRGRLIFSGGITPSRGHEGDNGGESAVLRLVSDAAAGPTPGAAPPSLAAASPVYGCPLFAVAGSPLDQERTCRR